MNLVTRECYDGTDNAGDNDWYVYKNTIEVTQKVQFGAPISCLCLGKQKHGIVLGDETVMELKRMNKEPRLCNGWWYHHWTVTMEKELLQIGGTEIEYPCLLLPLLSEDGTWSEENSGWYASVTSSDWKRMDRLGEYVIY